LTLYRRWVIGVVVGIELCGPLHAGTRESGDVLADALLWGTLAVELVRGDHEGAWQYTQTAMVGVFATEALTRASKVARPDGGNNKSFPSGHASRSFVGAAYVHRRHGLMVAAPLYMAATYVGYSRVDARRHRWIDVAGSAAVSMAAAWWLVEPAPRRAVVVPMFGPRRIGVALIADF